MTSVCLTVKTTDMKSFVLRSFRNNLEENHHLRTRDMSPEKIGSFTSLTKINAVCNRFRSVDKTRYMEKKNSGTSPPEHGIIIIIRRKICKIKCSNIKLNKNNLVSSRKIKNIYIEQK